MDGRSTNGNKSYKYNKEKWKQINGVKTIEVLLWSIIFPGFGQILNGKYLKGIVLIPLIVLIIVKGNLNLIILSSLQGDVERAIQLTNHKWILFFPCLYFFAIWDAYKDAGGGEKPYSSFLFLFSGYFMTIGTIFSTKITLFDLHIAPIWLPVISVIPGILVGLLLQWIIISKENG
ncbi:hypothetical protein [Cytobacillus kochii]|uniref:hypothetical protein n=1 Tax=Cytobacillus kochii TaxID=859143 RepID=UPI00384EFFD0